MRILCTLLNGMRKKGEGGKRCLKSKRFFLKQTTVKTKILCLLLQVLEMRQRVGTVPAPGVGELTRQWERPVHREACEWM